MARLIQRMKKGFNICVFPSVETRPFAVYSGDVLIKRDLTFLEAEEYCFESIQNLESKKIGRAFMRNKRKEKKLTIRGIAPLIGISWQHYSDLEAGRKNPSIELAKSLAEFFEVEWQKFFEQEQQNA